MKTDAITLLVKSTTTSGDARKAAEKPARVDYLL